MTTLLQDLVEQFERSREQALAEADRLAKANDEMCDEIFALRQRVAELEAKLEEATSP